MEPIGEDDEPEPRGAIIIWEEEPLLRKCLLLITYRQVCETFSCGTFS
ncbi:mCG147296 [Mus musculus]|nr:mCG147296 [Mus musculus]